MAHSGRPSQTSTLNDHTAFGPDKDKKSPPSDKEEKSAGTDEKLRQTHDKDVEAQEKTDVETIPSMDEIRVSLRDVNPIRPMIVVLRRLNNVAVLCASGLSRFSRVNRPVLT